MDEGRAIRIANAAVGDRFWDDDIFLHSEFKDWFDRRFSKRVTRDPRGRILEESEEVESDDTYDSSPYRLPFADAVYDREFTTKQRKSAAESGAALPGGGFPIHNKEDLANAKQALGRAKNRAAAIAHIKKRAKALGVELPEGWPSGSKDSSDDYHELINTVSDDRELSFNDKEKVCPECDGDGEIDGEECENCDGEGVVETAVAADADKTEKLGRSKCTECEGRGVVHGRNCQACDGTGWIKDEEKMRRQSMAGNTATDELPKSVSLRMFDTIQLDDAAKVRQLENGYIAAMPRIARTGVQIYKGDECGRATRDFVRVYRPLDSVFANDAVHSYTHLPVTLEHPPTPVDASNWKQYAVGETGDEVLRDGNSVRVPMMLRDSAAIAAFKQGKNQLSVGYDCDLEWIGGQTKDGEPYDCVQKAIRANHLAVVTAARGGSTLRIGDDGHNRGDDLMSNTKRILVDGLEVEVIDSAAPVIQRTISNLEVALRDARKKIKEMEEEDEDDAEENQKKDAALKLKDETIKERDGVIANKDAEVATLKKQLQDTLAKLSPAAIDAAVKDRMTTIMKARAVLGDRLKADGMPTPDIRRAAVDSRMGDQSKEWNDQQIESAFAMLQVNTTGSPQRTSIDDVVTSFGRPGAGYQTPQQLRDAAYAEYERDIANAWRTPAPGQQH